MKQLILFLCIIPFALFSQEIKIEANEFGLYSSQLIIPAKGVDQSEISKAIMRWIATSFGAAQIELEDLDNRQIITSNVIDMTAYDVSIDARILYTSTIDVKDEKLRITMENFVYYTLDNGSRPLEGFTFKKGIIKRSKRNIEANLDKLSIELAKVHNTNSDW